MDKNTYQERKNEEYQERVYMSKGEYQKSIIDMTKKINSIKALKAIYTFIKYY